MVRGVRLNDGCTIRVDYATSDTELATARVKCLAVHCCSVAAIIVNNNVYLKCWSFLQKPNGGCSVATVG